VIQQRLLVTGGAVTQMLDALEQHELIRRSANPHDRRSILIEITPAGRRLRQEFEPYLSQLDARWMAPLSSQEQIQLATLLARVAAHLEAHPEEV
jgi:DNA-binding MarR family transcriptional regulator